MMAAVAKELGVQEETAAAKLNVSTGTAVAGTADPDLRMTATMDVVAKKMKAGRLCATARVADTDLDQAKSTTVTAAGTAAPRRTAAATGEMTLTTGTALSRELLNTMTSMKKTPSSQGVDVAGVVAAAVMLGGVGGEVNVAKAVTLATLPTT